MNLLRLRRLGGSSICDDFLEVRDAVVVMQEVQKQESDYSIIAKGLDRLYCQSAHTH